MLGGRCRRVDSEPRFLYSCDAQPAKERGSIPESINRNVTQTLASPRR